MLLVDVIIVALLAAYAFYGYRQGFLGSAFELVALLLGLIVAFAAYRPVAGLLGGIVPVPEGIVGLLAFLAIWFLAELLLILPWRLLRGRIPERIQQSTLNRTAGPLPSALRGLLLLGILLLVVASAPLPSSVKDPILGSALAKPLVTAGTEFQQDFSQVFGQALRDTLAFKTIKTDSGGSVELGFTTTEATVCQAAEQRMIELVNQERTSRGLVVLQENGPLREVARAHSRDMLARGYFAHVNPDGQDPFDRMAAAGISYQVAGENLALAPTVEIAHTGLMNSPGHRANILKPDYRQLGIGCLDAGLRGRMFSQEFTG